MRTTITIDDDTFEELMQLADTDNRTRAVNLAVREFIRHERLRRFKRLRGSLHDLPSNEEIEAIELGRSERLASIGDTG